MKKKKMMQSFILALAGGFVAAAAFASDSWSIKGGAVRVLCPLTVGGSFEAATPEISGSTTLAAPRPPTFTGDIVVDLRNLDTGINLRNRHLRENYLEVGRGQGYDKAVLSQIKLGDVDAATFQGKTSFAGTLQLHGVAKPVSGHAQIQRSGSNIQVDATFPVRLADHAIEKPQYLGVGVKSEVQVRVSFVATPEAVTQEKP